MRLPITTIVLVLVCPAWGAVGGEGVSTESDVLRVDWFGRWSYAAALVPYALLLAGLAFRFRVVVRFATWRTYLVFSVLVFIVLGFLFEWLADVLFVWTFPPGRYLFLVRVPLLGWLTGHEVPLSELLWIIFVVPLFYYLYLWTTLVFYDVIYVVDENKRAYKKEERWVGFHRPTRILTRPKGMKGREYEEVLLYRKPGVVARVTQRMLNVRKS